jgi:predicted AAA+ superfamily ATPase
LEDDDVRRQILRNYLDVALLRDVIERHAVTNILALRSLIRHVMAAPATRFSINKFYNTLRSRGVRCTKNNLYEYLDFLSDAYLIFPAPIHSRSEKVRQVNPKKIYVIDNGLLSAMSFGMTEDKRALLENLVYLHLRREGWAPEYFVSDTGTEVDFVLPDRKGTEKRLIQACWSLADTATRKREVRALQTAMHELGLNRGTIVTWLEEGSVDRIEIVPAWKWLLTRDA